MRRGLFPSQRAQEFELGEDIGGTTGTWGTETSNYPKEKESTEILLLAASEHRKKKGEQGFFQGLAPPNASRSAAGSPASLPPFGGRPAFGGNRGGPLFERQWGATGINVLENTALEG